MANQQFVIFDLNNESFGIAITQIREIIKPVEIFKVPDTPTYIEGLINLRGKVHTVFNLRKKLNLPPKEIDDTAKIIIVSFNDTPIGFVVDEVNEIIRVEDESIEPAPQSISSVNVKFISGVAKVEDKIILIFDLQNALSQSDEKEIMRAVSYGI
ncbi:MAG TPA: chemotaxis protein CheW [Clostridia bacterium]